MAKTGFGLSGARTDCIRNHASGNFEQILFDCVNVHR
jgi:hypothetical protein